MLKKKTITWICMGMVLLFPKRSFLNYPLNIVNGTTTLPYVTSKHEPWNVWCWICFHFRCNALPFLAWKQNKNTDFMKLSCPLTWNLNCMHKALVNLVKVIEGLRDRWSFLIFWWSAQTPQKCLANVPPCPGPEYVTGTCWHHVA